MIPIKDNIQIFLFMLKNHLEHLKPQESLIYTNNNIGIYLYTAPYRSYSSLCYFLFSYQSIKLTTLVSTTQNRINIAFDVVRWVMLRIA